MRRIFAWMIPFLVFASACQNGSSAPPTYMLTLSPGADGTLTASPAGPYVAGSLVTLTAMPNASFKVASWTGTDDDTSTSPTNHVTITGNRTVSVTFTPVTSQTFTLTLTPGANGSVTANPVGPTYADGTTVALTAVPDNGFQVASWTGTDNDFVTTTTNTVTMTANKSVGVTFVAVGTMYTLTLISAPDDGVAGTTWGHIHADPPGLDYVTALQTEMVQYAPGTVVMLTAHQKVSTWPFTQWDVTIGATTTHPTTCSTQVTMNQDITVTANFPLTSGTGCP